MTEFPARPASFRRTSVHPTITENQISALVDQFYTEIRNHSGLGPIFQLHLDGHWDEHLDKMKSFWRSVLLRSGEYKGKPVPVHQKLDGIGVEDFGEWLTLFARVSREIFEPDATPLVVQAAENIATSLWLSRTNDPFASPPDWPHLTQFPSK
ncbi:MAG: group III truncated hemoglobin [Rhizobiaceae bacterium]